MVKKQNRAKRERERKGYGVRNRVKDEERRMKLNK